MNLHKYDNIRLNSNIQLNDKIKALFLLFDRDVNKNRLNYSGSMRLMNFYIDTLIHHEEFEAVVAFKERKKRKLTKYKKDKRKITAHLIYRVIRKKLSNFISKKLHNCGPIWEFLRTKSN